QSSAPKAPTFSTNGVRHSSLGSSCTTEEYGSCDSTERITAGNHSRSIQPTPSSSSPDHSSHQSSPSSHRKNETGSSLFTMKYMASARQSAYANWLAHTHLLGTRLASARHPSE